MSEKNLQNYNNINVKKSKSEIDEIIKFSNNKALCNQKLNKRYFNFKLILDTCLIS